MALAAPYQQNAAKYRQAQVETATPAQLLVMLYDGAIRFLSIAREKMESRDLESRHTNLIKAQKIIAELLSSLDMKRGGEVAANLQRVYTFMLQQLVEANINDKVAPIDEVLGMLRELRESWADVAQQNLCSAQAVVNE